MKRKQGFTLIELLVVILIIGILAAILIVAVIGRLGPAKINTTYQRMTLIEEGLARFIRQFPQRNVEIIASGTSGIGLPKQEEFAGLIIRGLDVSDMTGGEFLRLILFPTDIEIEENLAVYGITEAVMTNDEVQEMINEKDATDDETDRTIPAGTAFVDTWNSSFYYRFPGYNHSDQGYDNRKHININDEYGKNHAAGKPVPDIWSCGPNGVNNEKDWAEANDPFGETTNNDDICNWFAARR